MSSNRYENYKKCFEIFENEKIWSFDKNTFFTNFRKWSLKNHPDKIGSNEKYSIVANCKNIVDENFEIFKTIATSSYKPSTKASGTNTKCKPDQEINPETGRCRKKCRPDQERDPKTGRCRKKCEPNQERNSKTGRCRKSK